MLFYNEDWMHFLFTRYAMHQDITEENLNAYIDTLGSTQVTDFAMNVNGTVSSAFSKTFETFADKYLAKKENGYDVDYTNTFAKSAYILREKNLDMYAVWVKALRRNHIRPWLSIRMNDCHDVWEKTGIRKSSYVEAHPQLFVSAHREHPGYFDKCFDFTFPEVRERIFTYIAEMVGQYDTDGVELDFTREFRLFCHGFEAQGQEIMRSLFERIRALLDEWGEKRHKRIMLSLLLPSSPIVCMESGLNIFDYMDMFDYITAIPRWETIDTDMPIELWKTLLRGHKTRLGAGQQLLYRPYRWGKKDQASTVQMAFGQAISNLSRGADFVYLYNYMDYQYLEVKHWGFKDSICTEESRKLMFGNLAEKETLLKQERCHVVTYSDFESLFRPLTFRLPMSFDVNAHYVPVKIPVGQIPDDADVTIVLGIDSEKPLPENVFEVYINGARCPFLDTCTLNPEVYDKTGYRFRVTENRFDIMIAEIRILADCKVEHIEVDVVPAK